MGKKILYTTISDFLHDDLFVAWRLFRTDELNAQWADFIRENPQSEQLLQQACTQFEAVKLNDIQFWEEKADEWYMQLKQRINTPKKAKRRTLTLWFSAAASLIILIASVTIFALRENRQPLVAQSDIEQPSQNGVQLITGNEIIDLQSDASITLSNEGQAEITDATKSKKDIQLAHNQQNKLIVPYGTRSSIQLSDGTRVWLNSGTEMDFPTHFSDNSRDINVKGEIYIEVAKKGNPFVVHTNRSAIEVMGTTFNITAYNEDAAESVVLVEGRVRVIAKNNASSIMLSSSEMAVVSSDKIDKKTVDVSAYISWKDGVLQFNRAPVSEVLKKLERYYNYNFQENVTENITNETFSGKFVLTENIDSVKAMVSFMTSSLRERKALEKNNKEN